MKAPTTEPRKPTDLWTYRIIKLLSALPPEACVQFIALIKEENRKEEKAKRESAR